MAKGDGVKSYAIGRMPLVVYFPDCKINCWNCPQLAKDYGLDRTVCRITGELIHDPKGGIGRDCKLEFEGGMSCDSTTK